jgi:O-methyltransferase
MFRPREMALLVDCLTETHKLSGPIFEIGCAAGHTTVVLNKHLDDLEDSRSYFCVDTFSGFTEADVAVEAERGHEPSKYAFLFRAYRKEWFDQTMRNNHITRVTSIQADVSELDFSPYENISCCLVDVDLERPVAQALREVYPRMAPGGIIVVDDCAPNRKYEGGRMFASVGPDISSRRTRARSWPGSSPASCGRARSDRRLGRLGTLGGLGTLGVLSPPTARDLAPRSASSSACCGRSRRGRRQRSRA